MSSDPSLGIAGGVLCMPSRLPCTRAFRDGLVPTNHPPRQQIPRQSLATFHGRYCILEVGTTGFWLPTMPRHLLQNLHTSAVMAVTPEYSECFPQILRAVEPPLVLMVARRNYPLLRCVLSTEAV